MLRQKTQKTDIFTLVSSEFSTCKNHALLELFMQKKYTDTSKEKDSFVNI